VEVSKTVFESQKACKAGKNAHFRGCLLCPFEGNPKAATEEALTPATILPWTVSVLRGQIFMTSR
jgi:hypothetical protein